MRRLRLLRRLRRPDRLVARDFKRLWDEGPARRTMRWGVRVVSVGYEVASGTSFGKPWGALTPTSVVVRLEERR